MGRPESVTDSYHSMTIRHFHRKKPGYSCIPAEFGIRYSVEADMDGSSSRYQWEQIQMSSVAGISRKIWMRRKCKYYDRF